MEWMQVPEDPVKNEVLQPRVVTGNSAMSVDKVVTIVTKTLSVDGVDASSRGPGQE